MSDFITVWENFVGIPLNYDTMLLHAFVAVLLISFLDLFIYCIQKLMRR